LEEKLPTHKLPTIGNVLKVYYYNVQTKKPSIVLSNLAKDIIKVWTDIELLKKPKRSIVKMLKVIVSKFIWLQKNKSSALKSIQNKQRNFQYILLETLHITPKGTCEKEDKLTYRQRIDSVATINQPAAPKRKRERYEDDSDEESSRRRVQKEDSLNATINVLKDPMVTSFMDRLNISDNSGVMLIGCVASALAKNIEQGTLPRSSLMRNRMKKLI